MACIRELIPLMRDHHLRGMIAKVRVLRFAQHQVFRMTLISQPSLSFQIDVACSN